METMINEQIMSDNINELSTALAKAQAEFTTAKKDKDNPFFKSKYADFESVVSSTRPALTKYGLSVVQNVYRFNDGHHYLVTLLLHASGQWIKSKAQHNPLKSDIQSLSSYNTYLKRMCYSSLVGAITSDHDDDGNSASNQSLDSAHISYLISLPEDLQAKICAYNKVSKIEDLTLEQYEKVVSMLKNRPK
jgi:hypothetical protein